MADADGKPKPPRSNTSGAASRRSGNSRASSPHPPLTRLISGRHLDDHPLYHGHRYDGEHRDDKALGDETSDDDADDADDGDLTEKDTQDGGIEPESGEDTVPEVRDGIEDQRDLEAGPKLETSKRTRSGRSARDPNLVTWDGPEDPDNPKNWTKKRKWAATLVGKCFSMMFG